MNKTIRKSRLVVALLAIITINVFVYGADHYEHKPLGSVQPGDAISATVNPPGEVTSGGITNNGGWPWMGGPASFNATVPIDLAGAHSSQFDGTYKPSGNGGEGERIYTWEMDVTANGGLGVQISGANNVVISVQKTYTASGTPTGGTYTWEVIPGSGTANIDYSTGVLTGTQAGEVTVKVTYEKDGNSVTDEMPVSIVDLEKNDLITDGLTGKNTTTSFTKSDNPLLDPCAPTVSSAKVVLIARHRVYSSSTPHNYQIDMEGFTIPNKDDLEESFKAGWSWTKTFGPSSGNFVVVDKSNASFYNPLIGGIYKFKFSILAGNEIDSQVLLPLGGPEAISYVLTQAPKINALLLKIATLDDVNAALVILFTGRTLDWYGNGQPTGCLKHDPGTYRTLTIGGVVVSRAKLQNFL